jgi:hypothetical protein
LLGYTKKLTETPAAVDDADFDALRAADWRLRPGLPMDGPQLGDQLVKML